MSVRMSAMVFERYPSGGNELVMALALADHAHDDGTHIFPGIPALMKKTRMSERSVQNYLRKMQDIGWLQVASVSAGGPGRYTEYRINPDWIAGMDLIDPDDEEAEDESSAATPNGANSAPLAPVDNLSTTVQPDTVTVQTEVANGANSGLHICKPSGNQIQPYARACDGDPNASGGPPAGQKTELPSWLPPDVWRRYLEHRERIGSPLGPALLTLELSNLNQLRLKGNDPTLVIEQSIQRGWKGVFKLKPVQTSQQNPKPSAGGEWWSTESGTLNYGREIGVEPRPGESMADYRKRLRGWRVPAHAPP